MLHSHASTINLMSAIITYRKKTHVVINSSHPLRVKTGTQTVCVHLSNVYMYTNPLSAIQKEPMNIIWLVTNPQQLVVQETRKQNLSWPPAHSLPRGLTQTVCLSVRLSSENAEVQTRPSRQ